MNNSIKKILILVLVFTIFTTITFGGPLNSNQVSPRKPSLKGALDSLEKLAKGPGLSLVLKSFNAQHGKNKISGIKDVSKYYGWMGIFSE